MSAEELSNTHTVLLCLVGANATLPETTLPRAKRRGISAGTENTPRPPFWTVHQDLITRQRFSHLDLRPLETNHCGIHEVVELRVPNLGFTPPRQEESLGPRVRQQEICKG